MQENLDDHYNGENSIKAQEKLVSKQKLLKKKAKTKKKLERLAAEREQEASDKALKQTQADASDTNQDGGKPLENAEEDKSK